MPSRTRDACLLALALILASCAQKPAAVDSAPAGNAHAPAAAGGGSAGGDAASDDSAVDDPGLDEPPLDQSIEDVPPATAPDAASILAPGRVEFSGFGPVPFGAPVEALKQAWAGRLQADPGVDAAACHFLFAQPRPALGYGTGFMIEGGRFVRVDVDDPAATAPGGGRIGMTTAQIEALYPGRVEARPHKYVEGAGYLRVTGAGEAAVLLFETDADGRVQEWRVGLPPQVDYVEGCG